MTVRPDDFLRISYGPYLGLARRSGSWSGGEDDHDGDWHHHDKDKREDGRSGFRSFDDWRRHGPRRAPDELGYNVIVKFPVPSWHYSLPSHTGFPFRYSNLVSLTGEDGEGTPTLSADVSDPVHGTLGLIFVTSEQHWTANGQDAEPGKYRGTLEVTVTAGKD